ncbi:MAG: glycosyltransferase family 2 protein [Candidatus Azobacteroides sp.]|nr:glycosyltransferase family 2 protein [Candidatus Azobacteroides sp.]
MKISVVINTYNAATYLERVLETVKDFDEIVLCDMYSTDGTVETARKYNCRIIFHELTGFVEPARTFAIEAASHEWVLVVDADECVPEALKDFLYEQIKRENRPAGIRIPRKNYFMGRFMRSSYPNHILRFFKKDLTTWEPDIHAVPRVEGEVFTIPGKRKDLAFIHLANDSITEWMQKSNRYTGFELNRRKDRNYGYFALIFHPFVRFFRFYIVKGGFKDGKPGLIWAFLSAINKFITVSKVIESKIKESDMDEELKSVH